MIKPKGGERIRTDRDCVVQLTNIHPQSGKRIMRNLKVSADCHNSPQSILQDLIRDSGGIGRKDVLEDRKMWSRMRMMPTDVEDVHRGSRP